MTPMDADEIFWLETEGAAKRLVWLSRMRLDATF
eukprot:COSAG02_NODE_68745_length_224_cov_101.896000_2_plen_33_part_01